MKTRLITPAFMIVMAMLLLAPGNVRSQSQAPSVELLKPENIACQGWERDTVVVSWKDKSTDETGYKIERSDGGGPWSQIATVSPNADGNYAAYRDTGVDVSTQTHRYRVRAYEGSNNSPYSDVCNNRRIYDPQNFRIFYGLRNTADDCPLIDGQQVCLTNTTGGASGNQFVDLQYNALQGSADSFFRLGFANRADQPFGSLDKVPINVVWCDGGGCAGGGGIGLSPLLMETPFNLTTRAGDPIAYMVALHELWHFLQGKYYHLNDPNDRWVIEGQARSVQDKICIGGNRPTALCFDDIATGYAGYVPEVMGYLSNPNRPIGTTSYQAVLFWTYLTEKYGTSAPSDAVEAGMNFMLEFWEASENNHGLSGIATINKALESLGHPERFRDIWKDFAVANFAKDFNGPAKYRYTDMSQTGGNYGPVALSVDQALALNDSYLDTDETVLNWGAKYYQFRPASNVPFLDIRVTQDSPGNLYYTVLGIRGGNIVYEFNSESRHLNLALLNDNYDKVTVVVAGLENLGNYRISVNGTQPSLRILRPTTGNKARVGSTSAPDKFLVQVEVVDGSGAPMAGVNLANFSFQVGDVNVPGGNVLSSYVLMGQEWFVLRAPAQTNPDPDGSPNTYALNVGYGAALTDSEDDAVDYTPRTDADSVILLDKSGSMGSFNKLANAKNAAKLFVDSWRSGDKIGLISFNHAASLDMQLTDWTDSPSGGSRQTIFNEIDALSAGGGTRIGDTLLAGFSELQTRGNNSHDWALVLLSDGIEEHPGTRTFDQAVDDIVNATGKKPAIHTVAVGPDADRPRMQAAATRTGGTYQYVSAPTSIVTRDGVYLIEDMALAMDYRYRAIATEVIGQQQFYSFVGPASDPDPRRDVLNIYVEPGAAEIVISLSWNGFMGNVWLRDPNGMIVSPFQSIFRHHVWRIPTPLGGNWTLELNEFILPQGETAPANAPQQLPDYLVQGSIKTDVSMEVFLATPVEDRVPGHPMSIAASLTDNAPITGALVLASVEKPDGSLYNFWLWDDGNHNDGAVDDGLYGGTFYQTGQQGSYNVTVYALGFSPSLGENFYREKSLSFHMARVDPSGNEIPDIDTDGDGLPDGWEIFFQPCTNPFLSDSSADPDGDGASNAQEWQNGTDPCDPDTDDDGEADGTDPNPVDPDPRQISPPEAHAYPGVGQVYVTYSGDPDYQVVGLFRDESDDMDEFFTFHSQQFAPSLVGVFTDTAVLNGMQYCYVVAAIDTDGRRSGFSAPTCAVPNTDPVGPHGSVQINNGAPVTLIQDVTLNLWASDSVDPEVDDFGSQFPPPADSASGVTEMLISNATDFSGSAWESYATSKPWTLAQDSGLARVYVRYRDAIGNESDTYVATIWVGSGPGLVPLYLPVIRR